MPVSSDSFRHALGRFASGVTVVTTAYGNQLTGLTVSAFSSLSLDPPLILICIDKRSSSIELIEKSKVFNVNILAEDQTQVSNHFASKNPDKFSAITYQTGTLGAPLLEGVVAQMECRLTQTIDGGDHVIFVGEVEDTSVNEEKNPLLYYFGKYHTLK